MSVMNPIFTASSAAHALPIVSAALAAAAKQNDESRASVFIFIPVSLVPYIVIRGNAAFGSDAQQIVQNRHLAFELPCAEMLDDTAVFHHVKTVSERCRKPEILFDHHDRVAARLQRHDHACECLHDDGCEAFGNLIEQ